MKRNYLFAAAAIAGVLVAASYYSQREQVGLVATRENGSTSSVAVIRGKPKSSGTHEYKGSLGLVVPAGSYQQVVKRLERSAQLGNSEAAFGLYLKSNACFQALSSQLSDEEIKAYAAAGIRPEQLESSISKALGDCKDASPELLAKRGQWLRQAARDGNVEARLLYATDSEAAIGDARDMLRDPGRVSEYKKEAVKYLTESAATGNVDAMARLGDVYRDGILAEKSIQLSYSYYRAAENVSPGLSGERLMRMRSKMTPDQIDISERRASTLSGACCS